MAFVRTQLTPIMDAKLAEVNSWLASRTYLVAGRLTLADVVLYAALSPAIVRAFLLLNAVFPCKCARCTCAVLCAVLNPIILRSAPRHVAASLALVATGLGSMAIRPFRSPADGMPYTPCPLLGPPRGMRLASPAMTCIACVPPCSRSTCTLKHTCGGADQVPHGAAVCVLPPPALVQPPAPLSGSCLQPHWHCAIRRRRRKCRRQHR